MREPTPRFGPEAAIIEAAIEDTKEFLAPLVLRGDWLRGSVEPHALQISQVLRYLEKTAKVPPWVMDAIRDPLTKAMKKRTRKRTYLARELLIAMAAMRLTPRYPLTQNVATQGVVSGSAIVREALARMGLKRSLQRISTIASKYQEFAGNFAGDYDFGDGIPYASL
jgi:hypothetical protein